MQPQHTTTRLFFRFIIVLLSTLSIGCVDESKIETIDTFKQYEGFQSQWLHQPPVLLSDHSNPEIEMANATGVTTETVHTPVFYRSDGLPGQNIPVNSTITLQRPLASDRIRELQSRQSLALQSGWLGDVSEIYINEHLIGTRGSREPYKPGYLRMLIADIPDLNLQPDDPVVLTVVLRNPDEFPIALQDPVRIGPTDTIYLRFFRQEIISICLVSAYLLVGLFHLFTFFRRTADQFNLWFALMCLILGLYWLMRTQLRDFVFYDAVLLRVRIEYVLLFAVGPILMAFVSHFFNQRHSRLMSPVTLISTGLIIFAFSGGYHSLSLSLFVWQVLACVLALYIIYFATREVLRKKPYARLMGAALVLLMISAVNDVLSAMHIINMPHISRFVFVAVVIGFALIMSERFIELHARISHTVARLQTLYDGSRLVLEDGSISTVMDTLTRPLTYRYLCLFEIDPEKETVFDYATSLPVTNDTEMIAFHRRLHNALDSEMPPPDIGAIKSLFRADLGIPNVDILPLEQRGRLVGLVTAVRPRNAGRMDRALLDATLNLLTLMAAYRLTRRELIQRERLSALGGITASMLHETREPLTRIKQFAEQLGVQDISTEDREEYLDAIASAADEVLEMNREIREFARGEMRLQRTRQEFGLFLHNTMDEMQPLLQRHGVQLHLETQGRDRLLLDYGRFRRALANLVKNAVEAM
ncbi:MAG: sensor histidine kinase, partial [Leptospiraceae bacterium]|nr:sensor histidine kinase [Leptospiraceae bacterium]